MIAMIRPQVVPRSGKPAPVSLFAIAVKFDATSRSLREEGLVPESYVAVFGQHRAPAMTSVMRWKSTTGGIKTFLSRY